MGRFVGVRMRDLLSKAEHYRKQADKYHELAKIRSAYLPRRLLSRRRCALRVHVARNIKTSGKRSCGSPLKPSPTIECDSEA